MFRKNTKPLKSKRTLVLQLILKYFRKHTHTQYLHKEKEINHKREIKSKKDKENEETNKVKH